MGFTCTLTLKLSKLSFYCVGESEGGKGGERVRVRRVRRVIMVRRVRRVQPMLSHQFHH